MADLETLDSSRVERDCRSEMILFVEKKFSQIKWLNMNLKTDKEYKKRGDIVLLSEIITNSIYWQEYHLDIPMQRPF